MGQEEGAVVMEDLGECCTVGGLGGGLLLFFNNYY